MNVNSLNGIEMEDAADTRPILIVPYMWIGDFVRGHTVVRVLKQRWPNRPVDLLVTSLCAPLVDYMPGVRAGIVWDLPRSRLAVTKQWGLATKLRARNYGTALVLPRTWKAAIAPSLAGIPERVGFFGEARFGLINRMRWGEKALPRFIDKNRSGDRHADHGHLRPYQSLFMGAAERSCRDGSADQGRAALPALPAHRLHHERSPLHARHRPFLCG
jgi:heptosyltransferase-2